MQAALYTDITNRGLRYRSVCLTSARPGTLHSPELPDRRFRFLGIHVLVLLDFVKHLRCQHQRQASTRYL